MDLSDRILKFELDGDTSLLINTMIGGGCIVQQRYLPELDCKKYAIKVISEFIGLMKDKIMERAKPHTIVPVNNLW